MMMIITDALIINNIHHNLCNYSYYLDTPITTNNNANIRSF